MTDVQIHWFSIINSVIVVFFLAGILSMIIVKTLRRDIARYNQEDTVNFQQILNINKEIILFRMMLLKKLDGNCLFNMHRIFIDYFL
jgi:hypothetical protein